MNLPIPPLRRAIVLLTLGAGLLLALAWWVERGLEIAPPDAADTALACMSYAPFRRPGETPFDPGARVSVERIEEDLRILRTRTGCVRTYSVSQGLDVVPEVARRLGMRVKLGAWLGRDARANDTELDRALEVARRAPDVVDLLIVGNEVLLRGELPVETLGTLLDRARQSSPVPVSYADVWEFWFRHEALRSRVDVVTVHILPYWEDTPVASARAVDHVLSIAALARQRFDGTPLLVGETGWPAAGRQRAEAVPGRRAQARFARELAVRARAAPIDYNLIEGFDQPWKRALEGAMGGYWGVFDSDGNARFAWRGPIVEDPHWHRAPLLATLAGAAGLAWGSLRRHGRASSFATALGWSAAVALSMAHGVFVAAWSRTPLEWGLALVAAAAALGCLLFGTSRLSAMLADRRNGKGRARAPAPCEPAPGVAQLLADPHRMDRPKMRAQAFAVCRAALLFAAATAALLLVADPRYRGFPWALLAGPATILLALRAAGDRLPGDAREERLLAIAAGACAPAIAWIEGPANAQALGFSALLFALAIAVAWPARGPGESSPAGAPQEGRANTSKASSAAGTEGSAT